MSIGTDWVALQCLIALRRFHAMREVSAATTRRVNWIDMASRCMRICTGVAGPRLASKPYMMCLQFDSGRDEAFGNDLSRGAGSSFALGL